MNAHRKSLVALSFSSLFVFLGACSSGAPGASPASDVEATDVTESAVSIADAPGVDEAQDEADTSPDDPSDPVESTSIEQGDLDVAPTAEDIAESNAAAGVSVGEGRTGVFGGRGVQAAEGSTGVVAAAAAARCSAPSPLKVYPVRAKHDTGYQRSPSSDASGNWTCGNAHSNSDFASHGCNASSSHFGIDIWAARGAAVVASVSGTVAESKWSDYSGNVVTIQDACGWWHFNIHMKDRTVKKGDKVVAGQLIGHVSNTGTASNGVVHLHYSSYPGSGNYCEGKNPWNALKAVEKDVCWTPVICQGKMCAKGQKCSYFGSTLMCN